MSNKLISFIGLSLFLVTSWNSVYASNYYAPYSNENNPAYYIMSAVSKIKNFNSNSMEAPPELINAFLEKEIIPYFDFSTMARWIVGPYAQYMTVEDNKEFYANLKETFLSSLGNHLGSFDATTATIRYYPARFMRNGEANVRVLVSRPNQRPARLDFRMQRTTYNWKIIDVKANGTSAVLYYRNHFINQLKHYRK